MAKNPRRDGRPEDAPPVSDVYPGSERFFIGRDDVFEIGPGEIYTPPEIPDYVGDGTLDENFEFTQEELDALDAENAANLAASASPDDLPAQPSSRPTARSPLPPVPPSGGGEPPAAA